MLQKTGEQLVVGTESEFKIEVIGTPRRMPAYLEDDLLHLAQEAITNAVRHAAAAHIELVFTFRPKAVELIVRDNGCGFVHAGLNGNLQKKQHGFGLLGMEERICPYNGNIEIITGSGRGTEIVVRIPSC